jgi:hypothetical protein
VKTIQQYLKELDEDQLINEYIDTFPLSREDIENDERSGKEIIANYKATLKAFLCHLKSLELTPDKETCVLLAYQAYEASMQKDVYFSLVHLKEVQEKLKTGERIESYAYEFQPQSEIMSYLVADNKTTQDNIYELAVDVMNEASFFGYMQENLKEERTKLDEAIEEMNKSIESGELMKTKTLDEVYDELGIERPVYTKEYEDLRSGAISATCKFNDYNFLEELKILCNSI